MPDAASAESVSGATWSSGVSSKSSWVFLSIPSWPNICLTGSDSSDADSITFPSEALQRLVVLSHNHSQECGFIPNVKAALLEQERFCSQLEWECLAGHTFTWTPPASKSSPPLFCPTAPGDSPEPVAEAVTSKLSPPPSPVARCRRSLRKAAAAHAISIALASNSPCPVDEPEPHCQEDEECGTGRRRNTRMSPASGTGQDKEAELVCNTNSDETEAAPGEIPGSTEAPGPERSLTLPGEAPESVPGPPEEEEVEDFAEEDNMVYIDDLRDENYQPALDSCKQVAQPGAEDMSQIGPKRIRKAAKREILLCDYEGCGKIFSNRQYLNHHKKYQHVHQKTFTCSDPSCGKSFNFKKHLKEHEKLHSDKRDYICEFCARSFRTSSNLIIHRRIHTGEKPLQCEICGFTCRQKASLNWHMKKHDADSFYQFSCDLCGKKFEKKDNVTAHKSKSHPEGATGPPLPAQEPPPPSSPLAAEPMANPVQTQPCDLGKRAEPPDLAITVLIE
ncbi:zinc finger protein 692 isoform X2 [Erythrolamprus reginae]|uniref:zinc finger protein 692 isoform X2 n=1 Tax=Erythrolamprus reginae TaxID=121349 RepID=UPI00396CC923